MYLLCICPSLSEYIRFRLHKNKLQQSKQRKSYLTCLRHCTTVKIPVKKHESKLATKFPVSFQNTVQNSFHFLHSPGRLHWLAVIHAQLKHFHNGSSNHGCYLMHLRNRDQHSQTGSVHMSLSLTPLSTNSLNTKFHCAFSAMTVPISRSLSALQYLYCHANHNASGFNLKVTSQCKHPSSPTVLAHYRTSGVQLLTSYLTNVATKPRSLTKQTRPSRFSCQNFSFQLPSPGMTPGSVAPRTVHSVRPGSTTTWPTCRDVTLSYSTFLVWTYAAPCHPAHFLSNSVQCFLVILQALSLSLPKSPSFLVTLQALVAKVTTTISLSL